MNLEEFEDLVDRCGEVPAAWPPAVREDALRFLAGSKRAQEIVAEAATLRGLFGQERAEPAPANLADRIVALAGRMDDIQPPFTKEKHPRAPEGLRGSRSGRIGLPKSFLWLAACFAAGLGLGLMRGAAGTGLHIDFATLFAAVVS